MTPELSNLQLSSGLIGGLALFLFGMDIMTRALKQVAGTSMKTILARMTGLQGHCARLAGPVAGLFRVLRRHTQTDARIWPYPAGARYGVFWYGDHVGRRETPAQLPAVPRLHGFARQRPACGFGGGGVHRPVAVLFRHHRYPDRDGGAGDDRARGRYRTGTGRQYRHLRHLASGLDGQTARGGAGRFGAHALQRCRRADLDRTSRRTGNARPACFAAETGSGGDRIPRQLANVH